MCGLILRVFIFFSKSTRSGAAEAQTFLWLQASVGYLLGFLLIKAAQTHFLNAESNHFLLIDVILFSLFCLIPFQKVGSMLIVFIKTLCTSGQASRFI